MKQTAEVVNIREMLDEKFGEVKSSGSGGGFDHFPGMELGTIFCSISNGDKGSLLDEYMLQSKQGVTVLLGNRHTGELERHIGQRFWNLNTMVQILHIPEKKEQQDGTSA